MGQGAASATKLTPMGLRDCTRHLHHEYPDHLAACPYCAMSKHGTLARTTTAQTPGPSPAPWVTPTAAPVRDSVLPTLPNGARSRLPAVAVRYAAADAHLTRAVNQITKTVSTKVGDAKQWLATTRYSVKRRYQQRVWAMRSKWSRWATTTAKEYVVPHAVLSGGLILLAMMSPVLVFLGGAAAVCFSRVVLRRDDLMWAGIGVGAVSWLVAVIT